MIALDVDSGVGSAPRRSARLPRAERRQSARTKTRTRGSRRSGTLRVDGEPFRDRFTLRGDSLWWFAELYLHKEQAILQVLRIAVRVRRAGRARTAAGGDACQRTASRASIAHAAAARKVRYSGPRLAGPTVPALARMDARAVALAVAARLSRLRAGRARAAGPRAVAAFVHRAFWRSDARRRQRRVLHRPGPARRSNPASAPDGIRYVGIGPRSNFRARRWWASAGGRAASSGDRADRALRAVRARWRRRARSSRSTCHAARLWDSADLRAHAVIRGCDCWPLVREQLAGIALLQFPVVGARDGRSGRGARRASSRTSPSPTRKRAAGDARSRSSAGAAALPLAGLQHGFIYRHWLNYRHEPDEIAAGSGEPRRIAAFRSRPSTLLFDDYAARHLATAGTISAAGASQVTGSARLDELIAAVRALTRGRHRPRRARTPAPSGAAARPVRREGTRGAAISAGAGRRDPRRCPTCSW